MENSGIWMAKEQGGVLVYSGGSNSEHSNTKYIRKPNVLMFGFQMVQTIRKPNFLPFENQKFKMAALA